MQLNPSGAYETALGADWEQFYTSKRSSATRRRDRTKLKRLGELGEVRFVNPDTSAEIALTLDLLIAAEEQGVRPHGRAEPVRAPRPCGVLSASLRRRRATRSLVHLSRLDVGTTWAALNLGLTFRDCYFHVLASYDDGEVSRFGPGAAHLRELLRYAIARGLHALRLHHRRRALQARLVRDRAASARLFGRRDAPRLALGRDRVRLAARAKRAIKQTAPLWNAVQRLRAARSRSLRKKPDAAAKEPPE